ncbi:hypothetical protein Tco_0889704 [Tanacetum coccineum]
MAATTAKRTCCGAAVVAMMRGVVASWWWRLWQPVGEGEWRVKESGSGDRVDPVKRNLFGVGRKSPPEKFSGGGATVVAGSGGGGGWPDSLREKREL